MNTPHEPHDTRHEDTRREPLAGALRQHPVGTGVGGVAGGAAAGALAGTVFGPIGTLIGAGIGVVAGAVAGGALAERIDPAAEHDYWREHHAGRPYASDARPFDRDYASAYQYGLESRERHPNRDWDALEPELRAGWDRVRGTSRLDWSDARDAARDAWDRADRTYNTYLESDRYFAARFPTVPYAASDESFEDYRPAYRYGVFSRTRLGDRDWDDTLEQELRQDWERRRGTSELSWERARPAVQEAYDSPHLGLNWPYQDYIDENAPGAGLFRIR